MSVRHRTSRLSDSQRRNSSLSDTVSEARNSIRSSTDDLLFPRAAQSTESDLGNEESHWQSAPLALALLPAIAGVFFHNGSAVVTDVTLLVLTAIFLNWSVRLPWDWYRAAQSVRQQDNKYYDAVELPLESDTPDNQLSPTSGDGSGASFEESRKNHRKSVTFAANRELQVHELVALASCFILPLIGTWLLHSIRSKLSRPSEGLVSNYNLTIFLLASEIRPFSHLLKMVQSRTLYLQRIVASSPLSQEDNLTARKLAELTSRVEELEAHNASTATAPPYPDYPKDSDHNLVSQATADVRKAIQPDIDALNRAVRRYEKRTTLMSLQTDSRLRELEAQIRDALSLAAAAQRTSPQGLHGLVSTLFDYSYAALVIPFQIFVSLVSIPSRMANWCLQPVKSILFRKPGQERARKSKSPRGQSHPSTRRPQKTSQQQQLVGGELKQNLKKYTIPECE
ncbi:hypothetical protein PHISCL_08689 [Aspergillus sclerotialis]|uniref:Uncharacterized protein n=1 Tax=Aspergillus sclerotialis TaxID=2070753 RepID=A0A3A2ZCD7_9EURO|nr:hypothetical protein PHISCL_08689 [Aspergillus sclerotialis]